MFPGARTEHRNRKLVAAGIFNFQLLFLGQVKITIAATEMLQRFSNRTAFQPLTDAIVLLVALLGNNVVNQDLADDFGG